MTHRPSSPRQHADALAGRLPAVERLSPQSWSIPQPLPPGFVPYTLSYLLRDGEGGLHVIDPGMDHAGALERLASVAEAATASGLAALRSITVTHLHVDHLGLAGRLRSETGARIVLGRPEQLALDEPGRGAELRSDDPAALEARLDAWGVPGEQRPELRAPSASGSPSSSPAALRADVLVDDGDPLDLPGRDLRVIATPGHTRGSICVRDAGERRLFTGDHVLPLINPGLGLGGVGDTDPVGDGLASLDRLSPLDDHEVCPGHGYRFHGLAGRVAELGGHHRRRSAEIAALRQRHPEATVWRIAERVTWSGGWSELRGELRMSALAQTAMHLEHLARAARPPSTAQPPRESSGDPGPHSRSAGRSTA